PQGEHEDEDSAGHRSPSSSAWRRSHAFASPPRRRTRSAPSARSCSSREAFGPGGGGLEPRPCADCHRMRSLSACGTRSSWSYGSRLEIDAAGALEGFFSVSDWCGAMAVYVTARGVVWKASYIGVAFASLIDSGSRPSSSPIV